MRITDVPQGAKYKKVTKSDTPEAYVQSSHELSSQNNKSSHDNVGNSTQKGSFLNEILRIIGLKRS